MDPFSFDSNRKLNTLILDNNLLNSLPSLFESSDGNVLKYLVARHNKIESLDGRSLGKLLYLDLDHNSLSEDALADTLQYLTSLGDVRLKYNNIKSIDKDMFIHQKDTE